MLRRTIVSLSAAASSAVSEEIGSPKMRMLHKILLGEVQFKNSALLKSCNIEHNFGNNWKSEITSYAHELGSEEKAALLRQVARVQLTRFTTRELALYCGDGPENVEHNAKEANLDQGKLYLDTHGEEALRKYVAEEAVNANWSEEEANAFIQQVLQRA